MQRCRHIVIASEAKQSIAPQGEIWIASSLRSLAQTLRVCRRQGRSGRRLVAEIRLDRAVHLDGQRVAVTVLGVAGGDAHPALADAVFLDIGFLDALEADTEIATEEIGI